MDSQLEAQLVFMHGAGSSADFWHWQRDAFPDARYLNLPGHGDNPQTLPSFSSLSGVALLESYADWVASYIEVARLTDVVLNGHSMGGAVALLIALRQPRWLSALVLTGTGARLRVAPTLLRLLSEDYPAAIDAIMEMSFAPPSGPPTYAQKVRRNGTRRRLLRTPQQVTLADYRACDEFDVTAQIDRITLPTLCIVGAQDNMTPPKYSAYLHNAIDGSRLEIIKGAGHMLPVEKPEEYNRRLKEFINGFRQRRPATGDRGG